MANILSSYNVEDIRRRARSGRIFVTNKVIEIIGEAILAAADRNFKYIKKDLDGEEFENYCIDDNVLRSVRNHFETLKFDVQISKFRRYIVIRW